MSVQMGEVAPGGSFACKMGGRVATGVRPTAAQAAAFEHNAGCVPVFHVGESGVRDHHAVSGGGLKGDAGDREGLWLERIVDVSGANASRAREGHGISDDFVAARELPEIGGVLFPEAGIIEDVTLRAILCEKIRGAPRHVPRPITGNACQRAVVGKDWELVVVFTSIHQRGQAELFEVAGTLRDNGFIFGASDGGKEHARQDRDDGNDDEQFDESKATRSRGAAKPFHRVFEGCPSDAGSQGKSPFWSEKLHGRAARGSAFTQSSF